MEFNNQSLATNEINTHMKIAVDILKNVPLVGEEEISGYDLPENLPEELKPILSDEKFKNHIIRLVVSMIKFRDSQNQTGGDISIRDIKIVDLAAIFAILALFIGVQSIRKGYSLYMNTGEAYLNTTQAFKYALEEADILVDVDKEHLEMTSMLYFVYQVLISFGYNIKTNIEQNVLSSIVTTAQTISLRVQDTCFTKDTFTNMLLSYFSADNTITCLLDQSKTELLYETTTKLNVLRANYTNVIKLLRIGSGMVYSSLGYLAYYATGNAPFKALIFGSQKAIKNLPEVPNTITIQSNKPVKTAVNFNTGGKKKTNKSHKLYKKQKKVTKKIKNSKKTHHKKLNRKTRRK